nr:dentin sialophosphoprotein-like [Meriones unguiculatus]
MKIIIYICIWAAAWAIPVPQIIPLERRLVEESVPVPLVAHSRTAAQNELHIGNTPEDSSDPPNGSEVGQQLHTKDSYNREGNGSEPVDVGGKNFTKPILANEQGNSADENENVETYAHGGIHAHRENSTANGLRGQVNLTENGEAKESDINGHADDQGTKTVGASNVSQSGDAAFVQENGPQVAGSENSTNNEVGIHEGGVPTQETAPQGEGEGSENKGAEVTPGIGEDGFHNTDEGPSGDGEEEDEVTGSGDDEGTGAEDGKGGHDDSKGQEGQSHGGEHGSRGQSSVSSEDDYSNEKENSPNGHDGNNTSSSEENDGTEEGNGSPAMQENQKLTHKDNRGTGSGITSPSEACPPGKSEDQGIEVEGPKTGNKSNITKESGKPSENKDSHGSHGMEVDKRNSPKQGESDKSQGAAEKPEAVRKAGHSKISSGSNSDLGDSYDFDDASMQGDDPNSSDESNGSDDADSESENESDSHGDASYSSDESTDNGDDSDSNGGEGDSSDADDSDSNGDGNSESDDKDQSESSDHNDDSDSDSDSEGSDSNHSTSDD